MQIILYSSLLILGMIVSQAVDLSNIHLPLSTLTMICLAYIMIEVGLEFSIDKKKIKSYGTDYLVAATAAAFPWIFCALYFIGIFHTHWKEALLIARFAAPTSAGVLFAMLAAAGLGTTWLFRKAQVLAIFDDLDTVLLMIPLQILFTGMKTELIYVIILIVFLLAGAYFWLHRLKWPVHHGWLMVYGILVTLFCEMLEHSANVHLEVLLPSFALGCLLYNSHNLSEEKNSFESKMVFFDRAVKGFFMLLVGCSLPKISLGEMSISMAVFHVLMITVLANLGKCFPALCYRKEASLRQRIALSIAMFPRGEVGAGVLLLAINYGLGGIATTLACLSLALNLLLTGVFIGIVLWLIGHDKKIKGKF